jgi:hypothetical protein
LYKGEYALFALNAHLANKLIFDTSLREREIRGGGGRHNAVMRRTAICKGKSWGNGFRYSDVERNILLKER